MQQPSGADGFGVYLHVPFCATRCDYCAFATWTDRHHLTDAYLAALRTEAARVVEQGMPPVTSVFIGGGTPSLVPPEPLMAVAAELELVAGAEVTVECNPDTVTSELLAAYRDGGVTRISLGVQSMLPHVLTALGRTHAPENVARSVALIREAGFATFNLDLIYGGAGESMGDWRHTLDAVVGLDPPHVSAYGLTVENGAPLAGDPLRHPDDDDQADKYLVADEMLGRAGLDWYEISNWARPGHECRHNLLGWAQGEYLGLGCAAHSHRDGRRWWNVRTPDRYIDRVDAGEPTESAGEALSSDERRVEALQLALRTRQGVGSEHVSADEVAGLVEPVRTPSGTGSARLRLTREGRLLANEVEIRLR